MSWAEDNGIRALCFDIDGTLYPKWQTNLYLLRSALPHPVFSLRYNSMRQKMRTLDGLDSGGSMNVDDFRRKEKRLLGFKGTDEEYIEKYRRLLAEPWKRNMGFLKPFDGVRKSLEKARSMGYILAALSDFPIADKLKVLGLDGLFDYVASTEDYGYLKPNEEPFLQMLSSIDVRCEEALYAGDSYTKDVCGAKRLGMRTLLIGRKQDKARYPEADLVLTSWQSFDTIVLE